VLILQQLVLLKCEVLNYCYIVYVQGCGLSPDASVSRPSRQSCSLGLDVSVSRRSRDVFFKRLGLGKVREDLGLVSD